MNKVEILGRLTKDPEVRFTNNTNTKVVNFTLAVNRRFKKEGEPEADFINCVAWKSQADILDKYVKKGRQIAVVGRIQTSTYKDENNSNKYKTEVIVEEVYFADSKKEETKEEEPEEPEQQEFIGDIDDLPF